MDSKLLLIKATTLLFRESQLPNTIDNSSTVIQELLATIPTPEFQMGTLDVERETIVALKQNLLDMCANPPTHKYETIELLQKINHATYGDNSLYNSFKVGIDATLDESSLKRFCLNLRADIDTHNREMKVNEIFQKDAYQFKFQRETIPNLANFLAEHVTKIEPYLNTQHVEDPAVVDEMNFRDKSSMVKALKQGRELNSDAGVLKLGWQGLNRMTEGGLRRGECVVIGALQHNFKSGFTTSIFKHVAMYNKPYMIDQTKKPMLLRISFEDPTSITLPFLYKNIYENKTGKPAMMKDLTDDEIAWYIQEQMECNGYEIAMMQVNPSGWSYRNIINKVLELESQGYELHMLMLDYLAMVPTTGMDKTGPTGSDIRELYRRMANFCRPRKITLVTPHQLSTEAKMKTRNEPEDTFVQSIQGKGYWDGCKTIDHEVDLEIYIHIVRINGEAYLTVQRGKHRGFNLTPEAHKHCILKFEDVGDIRDDIYGPDLTRKRVGGGPIGSKDEIPHWDFSQA